MDKSQLYKEMEKYKPKMTSSERTKAYFAGQRVDHLPYDGFSSDWILAAEMGYKISDLYDIDNMVDVINKRFDEYKIEGFAEPMPLRELAKAVGGKIVIPDNANEYIDEYVMEDKLDMDIVEKLDPYTNAYTKEKLARAKILKERLPNHPIASQVSGPITAATGIRPLNKLLRDFRKNPDDVKALLDFVLDANLAWVRAFTNEFGPTKINIADPVGCDDILSPKQLAEFSHPYLKELVVSIIDITGINPGMHICGHTSRQWESFNTLGIDLYSLDNCEDLADIKPIVEDKITLMGNVPPVEVMRYGSIDDVINSVKICIQKSADAKTGFIVATGCDVPLGTPKENLDAFVYAVRKYSKDAVLGQMPEAALD